MIPLVSVIIPVFNAQDFLSEAIESVILQTFSDWELIIVDDCSTDSSKLISEGFTSVDSRIKVLATPINSGGPARPRNIGIEASRGELIAFLDADDIWHHDKLRIQVNIFESTPFSIISTRSVDFHTIGAVMKRSVGEVACKPITLSDQLIKYRTPTSSLLIHRSVFKQLMFEEAGWLSGREDLDFSLRAHSLFGPSLKIDSKLVYYRRHKEQLSGFKVKMFAMIFLVILSANMGRYNFLKIMLPFYFFSNIFYSFYFRVLRGSL